MPVQTRRMRRTVTRKQREDTDDQEDCKSTTVSPVISANQSSSPAIQTRSRRHRRRSLANKRTDSASVTDVGNLFKQMKTSVNAKTNTDNAKVNDERTDDSDQKANSPLKSTMITTDDDNNSTTINKTDNNKSSVTDTEEDQTSLMTSDTPLLMRNSSVDDDTSSSNNHENDNNDDENTTEKEEAASKSKEEEEEEEEEGDWEWGCCDGTVDSTSVECDECKRWWHVHCLKTRYGEKQRTIDRFSDPNFVWKCPACVCGWIDDDDDEEKSHLASVSTSHPSLNNQPSQNSGSTVLISNTSSTIINDFPSVPSQSSPLASFNDNSNNSNSNSGSGSNRNRRRPVRRSRAPTSSIMSGFITNGYLDYSSDDSVSSVDDSAHGRSNRIHGSSSDDNSDDSSSDDDSSEMFADMNLSEEEKAKMKAQLRRQKEEYAASMRKQRQVDLEEIKNQFDVLCNVQITDEEASFGLDICKKHQIDPWNKIENEGLDFIDMIRTQLADKRRLQVLEEQRKLREAEERKLRHQRRNGGGDDSDFELGSSDENNHSDYDSDSDWEEDDEDSDDELNDAAGLINGDDELTEEQKRKKRELARKRRMERAKRGGNGNAKRRKGFNMNGKERYAGRLLLDEAMKTADTFEGWSNARINAFKNKDTNPNQYYYRFLDAGQTQGSGTFTAEEHKLFMERIRDFGVNMLWGEFSMAIPQRVGYQCSNYFRDLVKKGWIIDPNYTILPDKKLKFLRGISRYKNKYDKQHLERSFSYTVMKDPSKTFFPLPANNERCPAHHRYDYNGGPPVPDAVTSDDTTTNTTDDVKMADKKSDGKKKKTTKKRKSGKKSGNNSSKKSSKKSASGAIKSQSRKKKRKKPSSDDDENVVNSTDHDKNNLSTESSDSPPTKRRCTRAAKKKESEKDEAYVCKTVARKKRKNKKQSDDNAMDEDEEEEEEDPNPMPDFMDIVTRAIVIQPALSPHGHVLGYDTWCKLLRRPQCRDTCPFTRKRVTRRSLIKLTKENFDDYKDQIRHFTEEDQRMLES